MHCRATAVFFVVLLSAAPILAQGLYWENIVTGGPKFGPPGVEMPPRTGKAYAMPKKVKIVSDDQVIIIRLDKESFYMVRPKDKTYSETTFADLEAATREMKAAGDQLAANPELKKQLEEAKKKLKDLPPEQRAAAEKALGQNPLLKGGLGGEPEKEARVEVASSGEKREIAGRGCTKFTATADGKEVLTAWTTTELKEYASLRADWVQAMKRLSSLGPMGGRGSALATAYEKIEGFPLETVTESGIKTTITKVEPRATPDSEFDVPADFTKTDSPLLRARAALKGRAGPPLPERKPRDGDSKPGDSKPGESKK